MVIGLSGTTNASVVAGLRAAGVDAVGSIDPDHVAEQHHASEFDVIAFGRGLAGPRTEALERAFRRQDASVSFVHALGPIAVRQVVAALAPADPAAVLLEEVSFRQDENGTWSVEATVRAHCLVSVDLYRLADGALAEERLHEDEVPAGRFRFEIEASVVTDGFSLVVEARPLATAADGGNRAPSLGEVYHFPLI